MILFQKPFKPAEIQDRMFFSVWEGNDPYAQILKCFNRLIRGKTLYFHYVNLYVIIFLAASQFLHIAVPHRCDAFPEYPARNDT